VQQRQPPRPPPLEDPLNEKEIFASEVAQISQVHGSIVVTFATTRSEEAVKGKPQKTRRVITCRLALTNVAAGQLLQGLQSFAHAIQTLTAAQTDKPN
jgi:hypothetical protein